MTQVPKLYHGGIIKPLTGLDQTCKFSLSLTFAHPVNQEASKMYQSLVHVVICPVIIWVLQVLVLSGHDHDQCTVIHKAKFGPITEVNTWCFELYKFYWGMKFNSQYCSAHCRDHKLAAGKFVSIFYAIIC